MKTVTKTARDNSALKRSTSLASSDGSNQSDPPALRSGPDEGGSDSIQAGPTQSDRVQPNPTTPPPPSKGIGKEMVKFLAIFDHLNLQLATCNLQPATPFSPFP